MLRCSIFLIAISCLIACKKDKAISGEELLLTTNPKGFEKLVYPADNGFSLARWKLGKELFYDKALSKSNTISCASCHNQQFAFSDNIALSLGDNGALGSSNSPSLSNIGYHPYYTRAGGVNTLEMHILIPVQEHNEFNTNMIDVVKKLKQKYEIASQKAYQRDFDAFVLTRAIANFERTLISSNSKFDDYFYQQNQSAFNPSEQRGYKLFMSEQTNCSKCHSSFNFSNYAFENNGLYLNYKDSGRMRLTLNQSDRAKFKVPSLRNIGLTAPYMHDGSLKTLAEVVSHYNSGGKIHENKSKYIKPLGLNEIEKIDLINFLNTLSDYKFIRNKIFNP